MTQQVQQAEIAKNISSQKVKEKIFSGMTMFFGIVLVLLLVISVITLFKESWLAIKEYGFDFFIEHEWAPYKDPPVFGVLPMLTGTLFSSIAALLFALPFSLALSVLMGEYLKNNRKLASVFGSFIEILAGIPSIIYGFWGYFIVKPVVANFAQFVGADNTSGFGILTASIILAIMILPYSASLGREVVELVPNDIKEAGYAMGATRLEVVLNIILPYASSGIIAGFILAFGRAIGETMAVTMVIGGVKKIPTGLFDSADTMASAIANGFGDTTNPTNLSVLIEIGFVLLFVTAAINVLGKYIIKRFQV